MDYLNLINRTEPLFDEDISYNNSHLNSLVSKSKFLVIGAAGTIGQATTKELFAREPKILHVVDINENNLVELVRDIRSTLGYIDGDFKTFAIDSGSSEMQSLINSEGPYVYVFNLSALKHVRSEKDPYTLMRMIKVNIFNTLETIRMTEEKGLSKYFCVSTDKAANPVNLMGASKRIMELFLFQNSYSADISTARFANVAFSDGSLLHGFNLRFSKQQPISAPSDVKRYFVTPKEAGELCMLSGLLGNTHEIFFPKLSDKLHQTSFSDIALKFVTANGYEPYLCESEEEARSLCSNLILNGRWPCYFFESDTTGEKDFEEFFMESETIDWERFKTIGVISASERAAEMDIADFRSKFRQMESRGSWSKEEILDIFSTILPELNHKETNKYLDDRM